MELEHSTTYPDLVRPEHRPVRILYVEDDAGLARLLQKNLTRHGFGVDLAGNGDEGLLLAGQEKYDVILLDYGLPGCSGMEIVRKMATTENHPPLIMVTGNGNEKIAVEAMKLGATDYIVKDAEMGYLELLPIVIKQVLQSRKLTEEREQILAAVRESEARYRKLVELSPDGIVICCQLRFEFLNQAAVQLLGAREQEELLGRQVIDHVLPDYWPLFQAQLEQIVTSGANVPWIDQKFVRLDGTTMDVEVSGVPFVYRGEASVQFIFRDITERIIAKQNLERMAHFDQLTGLSNRTLFFDRLATILEQTRRYGACFALLFLDLDRFKEVNDSQGHDKGDLLLKHVGEFLSGCLRKSDSVARMGGDEFTMILSRINDPADAALVAEKIIAGLTRPIELNGTSCVIGCSIGISIFPRDGECAEQLLVKADTAMYRAKASGGNNFKYYHHEEDGTPERHSP
jgi:diguanylate cyclase (GGDEF)-like protein/PAS domain S-box-containing protein